ncbi:putative peptidase YuxL [Psilocybe cubensis]|uniref:Dipeptidyl-peptidase V n=2 Tax=Psilocybe cubensis TaxID=181762 RepID=A0A8H7XS20_PSICU|nr:putative peptidase YuxL [Psilocybe cubensis]KAH9477819.1 putative peptidase YuxL [Psilocybe cubensis]
MGSTTSAPEPTAESPDSQTKITPQDIASSDGISELKLSRDGSRVVYTVAPLYKAGDNKVSALWLADTFADESARQITLGGHRNFSPAFHPTSPSQVYFLSDRDEAGGVAHLYTITVTDRDSLDTKKIDETATPVVELGDRQGVSFYSISPDGRFLAFILDTKTSKKGEKEKIEVWRENVNFKTLNLIDLTDKSKSFRNLLSNQTSHVDTFSWSPDSSSILYRTISHNDIEAQAEPTEEYVVSISTGEVRKVFQYPQQPRGATIWRENGKIAMLQAASPSELISATCLWSRQSVQGVGSERTAYGESNDVNRIGDLGVKSQFAVEVHDGLITKLDVYDENDQAFTVFQTSVDYAITLWDMVLTDDGKYVLVVTKSSTVSGEIENVWSGVGEPGKDCVLSKKLSSHNAWFDTKTPPDGDAFYWTASDGEKMEGVINYPKGVELKNLPTIIVAHGGPSSRDTLGLGFTCSRWRPYLASHGYLVLSPNYRGSTGRGDKFTMAANGGVGGIEWTDIEEMIQEGISRGIVDPNRIGIAGYSQGGFLSAWGVTRPNNNFKAGVIGAGVTEWGMLAATSDMPDVEAALGGSGPWTPGKPTYLKGSPLKDAQYAKAPILFLHGKNDARVPLTQAIGLLRGIEREGKTTIPPQLVVYPREDHGFEERGNAEDILKRVLDFLDKYVK